MNRLLAIVACLVLSACASTNQSYIRTSGSGATLEQAKNVAFREAIQYSVGTVVLSERESSLNKLLQDNIGVHSAGYVDDYKIVSNHTTNGRVYVTVDVLVSASRLADYKLGMGKSSTNIDANRVSAQYSSYMEQALTGDKLLARVLAGYPKNAYIVTPKPYYTEVDRNRNMILNVPYEVKWNKNFIASLNEALGIVGRTGLFNPGYSNVITMYKDPKDLVVGTRNHFKFDDTIRTEQIADAMSGYNHVKVRLTIKDKYKNVIHTMCQPLTRTFYSVSDVRNIVIYGQDWEINQFRVVVQYNQISILNSIDSVELSFDTSKIC